MKIEKGMILLFRNAPEDSPLPARYELLTVTAVRKASATLVRCTDSVIITYSARFPDLEIADPFKLFALSQKDLELIWNAV